MSSPLYTTDILRLAASLGEPRQLDREDGCAQVRSPTCGSHVSITVQLDGDRRVERLSMQVHACAFGQASAAIVAKHAKGRNRAEIETALEQLRHWLAGEGGAVTDWPQFETLAPARNRTSRHGAILLPLRALAAAMDAAV